MGEKSEFAFLVFLLLIALITLVGWWSVREPGKRRRQCLSGACDALRWPSCSDGRCRYHCGLFCKCLPVADGRRLRVLNGGRGSENS